MKKKIFVGLLAALFVGSCVSAEIALAATAVKPGSSSTQKKEFTPVYSKGTKSDGAKRGSATGGKPTNVHNLYGYSKHANSTHSGKKVWSNRNGQIYGSSKKSQQ